MVLLDHVAVRVTDMQRSIDFYAGLFGFPVVERFTRPDPSGQTVDNAALKVNDYSAIFLTQQPGMKAYGPEERPEHLCLTFDTPEFERVMKKLEENGVLERSGSRLFPRLGITGRSPSLDILDPDNNRIEVKNRGT
jgi:glyoxylase I family protein